MGARTLCSGQEAEYRLGVKPEILSQVAVLKEGPTEGDDFAIKKSLRNQFNFQERSSQTFNLPLREKGMKTDPPVMSNFSLETTHWMIFDSYMQQFEDMQRQELEE